MATKTDNASKFKIVVGLIAICLLVAGGLVYLQSSGGGSATTELAALSQAIPAQAGRALDGVPGAFDELDASIKKVASLRRGGAPGRSADWQQLESRAAAILAKRSEVEAVHDAAARVSSDAAAIVEASDALLDRSGSTAIIQEFQQRANRVREAASMLPAGGERVSNDISADIAYLRAVTNGLGGEASDLDIRPLGDEAREAVLVPLVGYLASLEEQAAELAANIGQVATLADTQAELASSANTLLGSAFGAGSGVSILPDILRNPWIPIGAA